MIYASLLITLITRLLMRPVDPLNIMLGLATVLFVYALAVISVKKDKKTIASLTSFLVASSPLHILVSKYFVTGNLYVIPILTLVVPFVYLFLSMVIFRISEKYFPIVILVIVFLQLAFSLGLVLK